ncbi:hypothetical protein MKEN_01125300 [Mycena kentingensis (nom. inval.)]|nr:hypothetical protein MKEN_01125300 [Mycena kentingensis (nom. inval.)]
MTSSPPLEYLLLYAVSDYQPWLQYECFPLGLFLPRISGHPRRMEGGLRRCMFCLRRVRKVVAHPIVSSSRRYRSRTPLDTKTRSTIWIRQVTLPSLVFVNTVVQHSYDPVNDRNFCSDEAGILVYDHAASWALAPGDMHVASDERKEICSLPSSPTMQRHEAPVRPAAPPSSSVATPVLCSTKSKIVVVFPALDSASAPSSNQTTPPSVAPAQSFPDPWTIATHPVLCSASAPSSTETTTPSLAPVPSPAEPSIAATPAPAPAKSSLYGVRRAPCTPASRSKLKGPVTFQAPTVLLTPGVAPESTWTEPAFPPSPEDPVAPPLRQVDFLYTLDEEGYADKCGFSWRVKVSPQRQSSYLRVKVLQTMGFRDLMGTCREKARKVCRPRRRPLSFWSSLRTDLDGTSLAFDLLSDGIGPSLFGFALAIASVSSCMCLTFVCQCFVCLSSWRVPRWPSTSEPSDKRPRSSKAEDESAPGQVGGGDETSTGGSESRLGSLRRAERVDLGSL